MASIPTIHKSHNPLKANRPNLLDSRNLNPYLSESGGSDLSRHRPLAINPQGKFIAKADELRAKEDERREKEALVDAKRKKGLLPDVNLQENLYDAKLPPLAEWWDKPYMKKRLYKELFRAENEPPVFIMDSQDAPVSIYIQHPVPVEEKVYEPESKLYLTKKEIKRKRRIERQRKHQDQQDRIRLGLDPPPPPKVKLSNLMNVLTNEAIKDPTGVEMKVRQEVEERFETHMKTNEDRKLTKEQRAEKIKGQHEKDMAKGLHTTVFKVHDISSPQIFFKIDMNAKQLDLKGIVLHNPSFNLVIVEGGAKGIRFYKKLMTRRIKWTGSEDLQEPNRPNTCEVVWEGQIVDFHFQKWSPMYTQNDEEAYKVLSKFGLENYWREAQALEVLAQS